MELRSKKLGRILGRGDARIVYEALVVITCTDCGATIAPGEHFTRGKRTSELGRIFTAAFCQSCAPLATLSTAHLPIQNPRSLWPTRLARHGHELSSGAARLLDWLIDASDGHLCRVTNDELVKTFRRHPTTIWKWIVELETVGLIRRRNESKGRIIEMVLGRDKQAQA